MAEADQLFLQIVVFKLCGNKYGILLDNVIEVVRMVAITKVPKSPEWLAGVISIRGCVVPIVDLRTRYDLPQKDPELSTPIIVVQYKDRVVGLVADEMVDVMTFSTLSLTSPKKLEIETKYVEAFANEGVELVLVIDLINTMAGTEKYCSNVKQKEKNKVLTSKHENHDTKV